MRLSWIARDLATVVDGAPAATNATKIAKAQDRARLLIAVIGAAGREWLGGYYLAENRKPG